MSKIVLFSFIAVALAAWLTAAVSAISLVRLAPRGKRLSTYFDLGWWRFAKIAATIGPPAAPYSTRYKWSVVVFFGCVVLGMAVATLSVALS